MKMKAMCVKTLMRCLFVCLVFCSVPTWSANEAATVWMEDLTWVELKARIDGGAKSVILPTGGVEQNGPYITLGKHNWVVAFAAQEIATALGNTLVAPVLKLVPQGDMAKPTGNLLFPGTLAVREDTFERVLSDTVLSLAYAGFQNIYLLGDHGLSQQPQARVARQMTQTLKLANVRVTHLHAFYQPELEADYLEKQGIARDSHGDHAGVADTAQILAVRPQAVQPVPSKIRAVPQLGFTGEPSQASAEMGRALLMLRINATLQQMNLGQ